jgi:hypothetical protein
MDHPAGVEIILHCPQWQNPVPDALSHRDYGSVHIVGSEDGP